MHFLELIPSKGNWTEGGTVQQEPCWGGGRNQLLLVSYRSKASQTPAPLLMGPINFWGLDLGDSLWDVPLGSWGSIYIESTTTLRDWGFPSPPSRYWKSLKEATWTTGGLTPSLRSANPLNSGLVLPQGWRYTPSPYLPSPWSPSKAQATGKPNSDLRAGHCPWSLRHPWPLTGLHLPYFARTQTTSYKSSGLGA